MYTIERLTADALLDSAEQLAALLADTVADGSSLGFLAPLDPTEATAWWRALAPEVEAGRLLLWVARADADGRIAGTVQLQ